MIPTMKREPLKPLIPLDDLKKVVAGLAAVPKGTVEQPPPEPNSPEKPRGK
jgi:hypothetical protein